MIVRRRWEGAPKWSLRDLRLDEARPAEFVSISAVAISRNAMRALIPLFILVMMTDLAVVEELRRVSRDLNLRASNLENCVCGDPPLPRFRARADHSAFSGGTWDLRLLSLAAETGKPDPRSTSTCASVPGLDLLLHFKPSIVNLNSGVSRRRAPLGS